MNLYIGQICLFPWDWAPRGWARCNGEVLSIAEYTALFALIGTEFGGDGKTTFALPKMPAIKTADGGDVGYFINLEGVFPQRN